MLSEHEQRLWDEIEHTYRAEAGGEWGRGDRTELPAPLIGGAWGAVLLVVFGVPAAGAAIAAATILIWLLWRFLPQLEVGPADRVGDLPADEPGRPSSSPLLPAIRWSSHQD
jgi:hypothetical protein